MLAHSCGTSWHVLKLGTPEYLRMVPPDRDDFCKAYDYGEKVDLSKGYWNPKRKMWVASLFLEIIKQP